MKLLYEPEVRDGFYVSSVMKRAWASQLEVLSEIDRICKKYDIDYYADWGTLLGTVRHAGYIAWDDDFDISMKRPDFMRFLEVAERELPEGYVLSTFYKNVESTELVPRIMNIHGVCTFGDFLEKYHGDPYSSGLDIFPLDYIPREEEAQNELKIKVKAAYDEAMSKSGEEKQRALIELDRIVSSVNENDSDYLASLVQWVEKDRLKYRKEWYDTKIYMPYEYIKVPVPGQFLNVLRTMYRSWIKPVRDWSSHEYPTFKRMEDIVKKEHHLKVVEGYDFNPADIVKREIPAKEGERTALILLYDPKLWPGMVRMYENLTSDENVNVIVTAIPYYQRERNRALGELSFAGNVFESIPEYVPFDKINIEVMHPDEIYFQFPYDDCDSGISVHPMFYTDNLRKWTDKLVYVVPYLTDEFSYEEKRCMQTLQYMAINPGVMKADEVYVQSENIRERYLEALTEACSSKYKAYFAHKIKVLEGLKDDLKPFEGLDEEEVPEGWWAKILDEDSNIKKCVAYFISASRLIEYKDEAFEHIQKKLSVFEDKEDKLTIFMCTQEGLKEALDNVDDTFFERFKEFMNSMSQKKNVIWEENADFDVVFRTCDAFYGDEGNLLYRFASANKPSMIAQWKD